MTDTLQEDQNTFLIIFLESEMFQVKVVEKVKTRVFFNIFFF